ncbi:MAG: 30S ribosomal protein S18 [Candidatus Moranbacteria bacterium]|nr:30S ribosomal protein S18 [Candidatus Moranbacteria bacterium]
MNNYSNNSNSNSNNSKSCYFCSNKINVVDYKDVILLRKHINTVGKLLPRKRTGVCSKHQRVVSKAVKRARIIGLLPFVAR